MSRTKLTQKQMERELADMLNAAHHYNLKSGVGAPFIRVRYDVAGTEVISAGECCAIGAAALIDCPLTKAVAEPYQCSALHFSGPEALVPVSGDTPYVAPGPRDGNSAMFHANDDWPDQQKYYADGPDSDMWELGYMFREAMQSEPVFTGCDD